MLTKHPHRIVGALSHTTVNGDLAILRQFMDALPQLRQRQADRTFYVPGGEFVRFAHIDQECI